MGLWGWVGLGWVGAVGFLSWGHGAVGWLGCRVGVGWVVELGWGCVWGCWGWLGCRVGLVERLGHRAVGS